jgi:hypothetical protein
MQNTAAIKSFSPFQIFPSFWPVPIIIIKRPMWKRQIPANMFDFFRKDLFMLIAVCSRSVPEGCGCAVYAGGWLEKRLHLIITNTLPLAVVPLIAFISVPLLVFLPIIPSLASTVNVSLAQGHHALAVFIRALFETIRGTFLFHAHKGSSATNRDGE